MKNRRHTNRCYGSSLPNILIISRELLNNLVNLIPVYKVNAYCYPEQVCLNSLTTRYVAVYNYMGKLKNSYSLFKKNNVIVNYFFTIFSKGTSD